MIIQPIVLEDILWFAAYVHYFIPGRVKIHSFAHRIRLESLWREIEKSAYEPWLLKATRRWLQKGEMPYPGYCRAPGSAKCIPLLCNCKKLADIWRKVRGLKY